MSSRVRYLLSAAVFVVLQRGEAICLLRRTGTGWMDGHFSLPAGTLEADETILNAAIREAREEVGVVVGAETLRHAHVLHGRTEGQSWTGHFFVTASWIGEPRVCEPGKHDELCWVPHSELPAETIPYVRQALDAIGRSERYSEYGWADADLPVKQ